MAKSGFLRMKTDAAGEAAMQQLIDADLKDLGVAARKLANHALVLGGGLSFGTTFLRYLAFIAAIYLLVLDKTNWRTNILTSLLVPYIFLSIPSVIFNVLRGEIGLWISFIAVILRLFVPRHFPDWLELPGSLMLLLMVAPGFFAYTVRDDYHGAIGLVICLIIGCYLLQEHIRATGGFRNSFTQSHGISNTLGIILLLAYPLWSLLVWIL